MLFIRKIRWLDNYLYSGNRGHSSAPQKKYQLYGRRLTDSVQGTLIINYVF